MQFEYRRVANSPYVDIRCQQHPEVTFMLDREEVDALKAAYDRKPTADTCTEWKPL